MQKAAIGRCLFLFFAINVLCFPNLKHTETKILFLTQAKRTQNENGPAQMEFSHTATKWSLRTPQPNRIEDGVKVRSRSPVNFSPFLNQLLF